MAFASKRVALQPVDGCLQRHVPRRGEPRRDRHTGFVVGFIAGEIRGEHTKSLGERQRMRMRQVQLAEPHAVLSRLDCQTAGQPAQQREVPLFQFESLIGEGEDDCAAGIGIEIVVEHELGFPDIHVHAVPVRRLGVVGQADIRLPDDRDIGIDHAGDRQTGRQQHSQTGAKQCFAHEFTSIGRTGARRLTRQLLLRDDA